MGPNWDEMAGAIGVLSAEQTGEAHAIKKALTR